MGQGNLNKVDAIVDEIVKNNSIFKLKSLIEQEREKYSMSRSINNALSDLNEIGKELVLQDLSVDPDEKFKGFIDNAGNIDISGITKFTATIVKEKIEEAEREGIYLRKDAPNVLRNKESVAEAILTVAVIDTMIKNYDNLSNSDIQTLIENYSNMPPEYQDAFNKAQADSLRKMAEKAGDSDVKDALSRQAQNTENMRTNNDKARDEFAKNPDIPFFIESLSNTVSLINKLKKINSTDGILRLEEELNRLFNTYDTDQLSIFLSSKSSEELIRIFNELRNINENATHQATEYQKYVRKLYEEGMISKTQYEDEVLTISDASIQASIDPEKIRNKSQNVEKQNAYAQQKIKEDIEPQEIKNPIEQEIQQLPVALENYSEEEIKEALEMYIQMIESIPMEEYTEMTSSKDVIEYFKAGMEVPQNKADEILEILAQNDFGGNLYQILTNPEILNKTFLPGIKVIIERLDQKQLTDANIQQGIENITLKEEEIIVATEQERVTQESQEVEQEDYSFINAKYLEQDSIEGLIPRNGGNSKAIQDDKTAIFYSQGKEGAIVMYFEFLRQYENLRGERGDKALQKYEAYQNGSLQLNEKEIVQLEAQIEQIKDIRNAQTFDDFMGDKLYLKIDGLDRQEDKKKADEWRAANKGTKMNYNYANSWTEDAIPPDKIDVVTLQRNDSTDTKVSQKDIIKYFMSQTSVEKIAELGINDTTLGLIQDYYEEHSLEISELGTEYSLVNQDIKEFVQSRENKMQTYEFVERNGYEEQEEYTNGKIESPKQARLQYIQDFLKFNKSERTSLEEVREQNDLIISIANEKENTQEKVAEETENDEKLQDDF